MRLSQMSQQLVGECWLQGRVDGGAKEKQTTIGSMLQVRALNLMWLTSISDQWSLKFSISSNFRDP